jgi:hypothetical protein
MSSTTAARGTKRRETRQNLAAHPFERFLEEIFLPLAAFLNNLRRLIGPYKFATKRRSHGEQAGG